MNEFIKSLGKVQRHVCLPLPLPTEVTTGTLSLMLNMLHTYSVCVVFGSQGHKNTIHSLHHIIASHNCKNLLYITKKSF